MTLIYLVAAWSLGILAAAASSARTGEWLALALAAALLGVLLRGNRAQRLAMLAILGLSPTFDAAATEARQKATLARLAELAAAVDPKEATVVVVGPRAQVEPQLKELKLGEATLWDVEGQPVK